MKSKLGKKLSIGKIIIYMLLFATAVLCVLPFMYLLAVSLSSSTAVAGGKVTLFPVDITFVAYEFVLNSMPFIRSFGISVIRVVVGVAINLLLVIITAYPMSKSDGTMRGRKFYTWFFMFAMLFAPSLIPSYIVIKELGMIDTLWALVLPCAFPIFNMVVVMNFFRGLPKALGEAATIDGAGHFTMLWRIYVPLSMPSLATITLYSVVGHWNSWFDGLIYMNHPEKYPLQSYLQTVIINPESAFQMMQNNPNVGNIISLVSNQTTKAAQLFIAMVPVLLFYPLVQKYFTTGLVLGSVKE
ncbi:MAG: carbohydrate ABC transporter permease [Oscillospiraceae bacterium]